MMSVSEEWNWVKCSENRKNMWGFYIRIYLNFEEFCQQLRFVVSTGAAGRAITPIASLCETRTRKSAQGRRIRTFRSMSLFRSSVLILFWHSKVHKDAADFPFPLLPHRSAIVVSSDCNINIGLNMLHMQCWNNKRSNTKLETKPTTNGPKQTLNKSRRQHAGGYRKSMIEGTSSRHDLNLNRVR